MQLHPWPRQSDPDRQRNPASLCRNSPAAAQHLTVVAKLGYLVPTEARPYQYAFEPPDGTAWQNCEYETRAMQITDARFVGALPSVHIEGFELWDAPSAVTDFADDRAILKTYYAEMAELACRVTGGARGYVFDHLVRKREAGRPALTFGRRGGNSQVSSNGRVHNDYTEESGYSRLRLVMGEAAADVERYSIVNIWRSIGGPIVDTPLGLIDARTVSAGNLVSGEVRYRDRTGEIYLLTHSAGHRWSYYSAMDRHEALVFKQYDSQVSGVARYTPHAAFDLSDAPPDAPLRESIELRCLVVYD